MDPDRTALNKARLEAVIAAASMKPCLLCGGSGDNVVLFVPTDPELQRRWKQPEGKSRVVAYALCDTCASDPTACEEAEARMEREFDPARQMMKEFPRGSG